MPTSARDQELLRHLDASPPAWVVTPTRRLARALTLRVAELHADCGREVADTPPIRSLDDWLRLLGQQLLAREVSEQCNGSPGRAARTSREQPSGGRILLSSASEQLLWEQVILHDPGDLPGQLLDTAALAATAADAWKRICIWGEPSWSGPLAEDVDAFLRWLPAFRARLAAAGFVTFAELGALVADAIAGGRLDDIRPAVVLVPGFEKPDPAMARILDAMRARGTTVLDHLSPQADRSAAPSLAVPSVWRAATPAAEVRTVASRIRVRLLAQPGLRIAVLAPDPSAYGKRLERVFEEELDPQGIVSVEGSGRRRFDYAEAPALADYPLIANALDMLSLDSHVVPFETVSRILLSEYPRADVAASPAQGRDVAAQPAQECAGAQPADAGDVAAQPPEASIATQAAAERGRVLRGVVEARLRRSRAAALRLSGSAASVVTELRSAGLARAATSFEALARHLERGGRGGGTRRSPGAWRREWIDRLNLFGWPGALADEAEGLVFRRWRDALDEFAQLEAVEPTMDTAEALARLRAICASIPVQPSSEGLGVQVMNLLDASGLEFDVIYALGMTATAFPAAPRPNPLLPVAWQRAQRGMPRASVEGERELAGEVWARILGSAPEVFVSYPATGDRNEETSPSALIAGLPCEDADAREGEPWWLASARNGQPFEERPPDVAGPPLVRRGGSSILGNQSDCPFRAFAATRLGAEKLDIIQPQPDASRRGTLVHAALAQAYRDIPSSTDLAGLSDGNIGEVSRDAALAALTLHADMFDQAADLQAAARVWLEELVAGWMRHERDVRTGTWTVEKIEEDYERTFPAAVPDPLTIRFRPDRVDLVENGALVVLDFKTSGTAKRASAWSGERPVEPQLPLYLALLHHDGRRVDGIAFANVSARDSCLLTGIGARGFSEKFGPPGKKVAADYDSAVAGWCETVESLALGYLAGDVRVDPRNATVCRHCGGQTLCRMRDSIGAGDSDDEGGDE